ncbi:hypothetical protein UFOVP151_17 [uncultured Caudovirales phage]|uniref:Uncharacterized protein n=1 Tax=uncultured Caudovirales phage TaxID=2100421 RepID=A0A6J7WCA8_9CAUD|nr:hypothetical protein UFOVP151_17 [uncultured Caudovirales phage]
MKQITPAQHLKASTTPIVSVIKFGQNKGLTHDYERFTKPLETQDAAIKRLMRELKANKRKAEKRTYPRDKLALDSVERYVQTFYTQNGLGTPPYRNLPNTPTLWPQGPEVEFSEEPELATQE